MKKVLAFILALVMCASLVACAGDSDETSGSDAPAGPVTVNIVTSMGGDDWMRGNYEATFTAWEEETGNTVNDASATADETWKAQVITDFETGAEPDLLYYFVGSDADVLVNGDKFVTIDEIRKEYPDFANNMNDDLIPTSCDGKKYAIPLVGYWEGLFANTAVLDECGVDVPGADYTWDQFLEDCETIKKAGKTPLATCFDGGEGIHYLFEFCTMNNGSVATHANAPATTDDAAAKAWLGGLEDIKALYEAGYLPANAATGTNTEMMQLLQEGKAAFFVGASWNDGSFTADDVENPDDFTVCYFPGKGNRKATDIIAGLSMGFYITKKGWEDESRRDAIISFASALTSTESVLAYAGPNRSTALKDTSSADTSALSPIQLTAVAYCAGATGTTGAAQDLMSGAQRASLFGAAASICKGDISAEDALQAAIDTVEE